MKEDDDKQLPPPKPFSKLQRYIIDVLRRDYRKKSTWLGFLAIAQNWTIIIAAGFVIRFTLAYAPTWMAAIVLPLAWLIQASRYRGFENLVHEASHYNLFEERDQNNDELLHGLYAFWVFKTVPDYRKMHLQHHAHIGDLVRDPDMRQNRDWGLIDIQKADRFTKVWRIWIRPFTGYFTLYHIRNSVKDFIQSKTFREEKIIFWSGMILLSVVTRSHLALILNYVIPFFLITPILRFFAESSEHINVFSFESPWGNSRSNLGWIHRFLLHPHSDGFHQVHHAAPFIPFHKLKRAHVFISQFPEVIAELVKSFGFFETARQISTEQKGQTPADSNSACDNSQSSELDQNR